MILSGQSIRERGIFTPFHERTRFNGMTFGLGPAGYDVRIKDALVLEPHSAKLAVTLEHFDMPDDVLGMVADKSTWARRFVCVQNTIIEPGWRGFLTLEITNHSPDFVMVCAESPIAQIILHQLDRPTEHPYNGKYQDQPQMPVPAVMES